MRTILTAWLLATSVVSVGHGQAAQAVRNTVFIAPNVQRTVTITRSGVVVMAITIPQGTAIGVTYDTAGSVLPATGGRFEFHGDVEVRALATSQRDPTLGFQDAVLQSPLRLTAAGVDVDIIPSTR
jgi:hypothetical protein